MSTPGISSNHPGETTTNKCATNTSPAAAVVDNDDPEKLLNEWLGELKTIIGVSFNGLRILQWELTLVLCISGFGYQGCGHFHGSGHWITQSISGGADEK